MPSRYQPTRDHPPEALRPRRSRLPKQMRTPNTEHRHTPRPVQATVSRTTLISFRSGVDVSAF
ncbi:hypothetical protein BD777DRAFT_130356 [Yarrowia lipolytica]|nr:hypothetical protein BD777DRAFT_130356 [Yarrowia lipolytica]